MRSCALGVRLLCTALRTVRLVPVASSAVRPVPVASSAVRPVPVAFSAVAPVPVASSTVAPVSVTSNRTTLSIFVIRAATPIVVDIGVVRSHFAVTVNALHLLNRERKAVVGRP